MPYEGKSRTPQGVRGLKCKAHDRGSGAVRRTPQGVRGLKSAVELSAHMRSLVAPRKGCVD